MKNKTHLLLALVVFILSGLYLLFFISIYRVEGDEGFLLAGAQRLLRKEIMYHDFYNFLTPGSFVFLAVLFKIFGTNILVPRITALLTGILLVTLTYLLAERLLKNRYLSLLPPFILLVSGFPTWFIYSHHWLSSTLALISLYLLILGENFSFPSENGKRRSKEKGPWLFLLAGFFAAFTLIFLQDKGLLLLLSLAFYLWLFSSKQKINIKAYLAGASLGLGLLFLYLLKHGTLINFFYYTFWWPLTKYVEVNKVPYFNWGKQDLWWSLNIQKQLLGNFNFSNLIFFPRAFSTALFLLVLGYLSILAIPLALILGCKIKKQESSSGEGALLILYALVSLAFFISSWHLPDFIHLVFGASLPLTLFFYLIQKIIITIRHLPPKGKFNIIRLVSVSVFFLVIATTGIGAFYRGEYHLSKRFKNPYYAIETTKGRLWTDDPSYAQDYNFLIPYLRQHLNSSEPFIVLNNSPEIYFFLDAYNPLNTDYYFPHIPQYNKEEQINHILKTIKQKQVRFVIIDSYVEYILSRDDTLIFPKINLKAYKEEPVRRLIEENYQPIIFLNHFTLYQIKNHAKADEK